MVRVTDSDWVIRYDGAAGPEEQRVGLVQGMSQLGLDEYRCIYDNNEVSVIRFADLHRHSDCSLMDGLSKIPDIVAKTEYAGALTDHGNMYGFLEYYKAMICSREEAYSGI